MQKKKIQPKHKFRLHIKKNHFGYHGYILVQLWDRKRDMELHTQYKAHAITIMPLTPTGKASKIITINFWVKRMGVEYVVHEILHAVIEWSNRNDFKIQNKDDKFYKDEEFFCQVSAELVKQFYKKIFTLGLTLQPDFIASREFKRFYGQQQ